MYFNKYIAFIYIALFQYKCISINMLHPHKNREFDTYQLEVNKINKKKLYIIFC